MFRLLTSKDSRAYCPPTLSKEVGEIGMDFLKGLILDLDGVVADTEDLHRQAYNRVFEEQGIDLVWSEQDYRDRLIQTAGSKLKGVSQVENHPDPVEYQKELYERKRQVYLTLLADVRLPPRPGIVELIREALEHGVAVAAASTCAKEGAIAMLSHTLGEELLSSFSTIKAGEDAKNRKPAPDIYLMAIEGLGLEARDCVAIEDSVHGMESALAAGLCTVVTPSQYTRGDSFTGANWVVEDLSEEGVSIEALDRLLGETLEEKARV
ncbi:MAG: HAD-IA family hydrolase [Candidatus Omnitrophica bacterium]|nr:HAD-IA family hydrolase [Candidatus Omnitrophota bacterium]